LKTKPGNAQHIGSRENQEDSFAFSDPSDRRLVEHGGVLAVVADGMGGMSHGGAASATAVRAFRTAYEAKRPEESIPQALLRALHRANAEVITLARTVGAVGEVGSTLAAVVVHERGLYWISVGDSRVYHHRSGRLWQITSDHTYAHELDERVAAGSLTEEEAQADPERGSLTSYIGRASLIRIDRCLKPFPLVADDVILLCSDGLYGTLGEAEITAAITPDPQRLCERLVEAAIGRRRPGQDNVTVLALKCEEPWGRPVSRTGGRSGLRSLIVVGVALVGILLVLLLVARRRERMRRPTPPRETETASPPLPSPSPTFPRGPTPRDPTAHREHPSGAEAPLGLPNPLAPPPTVAPRGPKGG